MKKAVVLILTLAMCLTAGVAYAGSKDIFGNYHSDAEWEAGRRFLKEFSHPTDDVCYDLNVIGMAQWMIDNGSLPYDIVEGRYRKSKKGHVWLEQDGIKIDAALAGYDPYYHESERVTIRSQADLDRYRNSREG